MDAVHLTDDVEKPSIAGRDAVASLRRFVGVLVDGDTTRAVVGVASGAEVLSRTDAAEVGL